MTMMTQTTDLIAQFEQHFPGIDFSDITTGYEQVERKLKDHVDEFTLEQWQTILDPKYSNLFQCGAPHVNWRTDREYLAKEIIAKHHLKPSSTWHETWYNVSVYYWKSPTGVILKMKYEVPTVWGSGAHSHMDVEITDKYIPVPTHRAVILCIASDTKAHIIDQFAGTKNECENWIAENITKDAFFKILPIK